jgi:hypothetical protein
LDLGGITLMKVADKDFARLIFYGGTQQKKRFGATVGKELQRNFLESARSRGSQLELQGRATCFAVGLCPIGYFKGFRVVIVLKWASTQGKERCEWIGNCCLSATGMEQLKGQYDRLLAVTQTQFTELMEWSGGGVN